MPFDHGSVTLTIFELGSRLPEDYVAKFAAFAAGTLDSVTDELQVGWVSGRHLLENTIDASTVIQGDACLVTLRKAVRKIPASLLNSMLRREELIWQKAHEAQFVPGKVKRELRDEILEKNLQKFPPAVSGIPIAIDPDANLLYAATGSQSQTDELVGAFMRTLDVEPLPFTPQLILQRDFDTALADFPTLELKKGVESYPTIGRDFLTYLWFLNESGGRIPHPDFGDFEIALDGPLCFAGDDPACNGAAETVVKKGENPLRSAEAKAAFAVGKKLKKAKLMVVLEDKVWTCTFDADRFVFGSLRLPEGEKLDADSVTAERMANLYEFKCAIEAAFKQFAAMMLGNDAERGMENIRVWAMDREGV
ncbi:MAG: recombination-associated protein RdgC [Victivallaceae bacterium]|nr:recombination-associated protein RdgC [Victivallaceae bacterium]